MTKLTSIGKVAKFWAIKESACFSITFLAGITGHEVLEHNAAVEILFTAGLGCAIEYASHKKLHKHDEEKMATWKRYALATAVSLATWPIHAALFHHHHDHDHDKKTETVQKSSRQEQFCANGFRVQQSAFEPDIWEKQKNTLPLMPV